MPRATKAIALTQSLRLMKQPRWPATSPITAVHNPTNAMEMTKVGYPLKIPINLSKKKVSKSYKDLLDDEFSLKRNIFLLWCLFRTTFLYFLSLDAVERIVSGVI